MKIVLKAKHIQGKLLRDDSSQDGKLEYFKKLILDHLKNQSDTGEVKKAGLPVGTVREWKGGKKVIKVGPGDWRTKYEREDRGAKMAVAAIRKKVDSARSAKELMDIVLANRDRFSDPRGNPLPFIQELSKYVSEHGDKIDTAAAKKEQDKPKKKTVPPTQKPDKDGMSEAAQAIVDEYNKRGESWTDDKGHLRDGKKDFEWARKKLNELGYNFKHNSGTKKLREFLKQHAVSERKPSENKEKAGKGIPELVDAVHAKINAVVGLGGKDQTKEMVRAALKYNEKKFERFLDKSEKAHVSVTSAESRRIYRIILREALKMGLADVTPEKKKENPPKEPEKKPTKPTAESRKKPDGIDVAINALGGSDITRTGENTAVITKIGERGRKPVEADAYDVGRSLGRDFYTVKMKDDKIFITYKNGTRQKSPPEKLGGDDSQESIDFNAIREKYQGGKIIEGNDDEIYVGDESMKGRWKLVEADAPAASHDETTFHKTRGFPTNKDGSTINDRDYQSDQAAQETVMSMSSNFDGRALSFDSPIVVSQDGIVVSGNNRTMSSKIAARKGADTGYIDALKKRAARFGFSGEDVEGFKHPRVVFEIEKEGGYSTGEFAKYNQESQKTMSPIESAVKVSKIIKEETVKDIAGHIAEFDTIGELYADKKACTDIFNSLEKGGIINQFNRNSYIDTQGVITGAGKEFLETVLIGSVVNEKNIRGLNREGCKHIRAKLVRAITPLVNNKSMDGYSIMDELNQAIDLFMQFNIEKDKFGTLDDLVMQGSMFEEVSGVAVEFARKMQLNQKDFAEFMQKMNASLEVGASGQSDIFLGEVETKDDVLKRLLDLKKAIAEVLKGFRKGKHGREGEKTSRPAAMRKAPAGGGPEQFDVALDFDGVINSYKDGWKGTTETDEPVPGAAEGILKLLETGLNVVIYSTRAGSPEGAKTIRDYLRDLVGEGADTISITDRKPIAAVYVDDRAVTFNNNWEEMPGKIENFKSWVDKSLTWSGHKLQGRTKIQGMEISIENKKGSVRKGTDQDGHDWAIKMNFNYGYIRGTVGKDKDHLDAYIGPAPDSDMVFIVHQNDPTTGAYDEDKVMIGFETMEEAKQAYLSQYDRPGYLGEIDAMDIETFKEKAFDPKNKGRELK